MRELGDDEGGRSKRGVLSKDAPDWQWQRGTERGVRQKNCYQIIIQTKDSVAEGLGFKGRGWLRRCLVPDRLEGCRHSIRSMLLAEPGSAQSQPEDSINAASLH